MISPLLAKLYGLILEKEINIWLESEGKKDKGQAGFRRHHSTMDHLVTLRIIVEESHNDKSNLFCCFAYFRKAFDTVPRNCNFRSLTQTPHYVIYSPIRKFIFCMTLLKNDTKGYPFHDTL